VEGGPWGRVESQGVRGGIKGQGEGRMVREGERGRCEGPRRGRSFTAYRPGGSLFAALMRVCDTGTYVALITVCRRQKQGDRALIVYEVRKASRPPRVLSRHGERIVQSSYNLGELTGLFTGCRACSREPILTTLDPLPSAVAGHEASRGEARHAGVQHPHQLLPAVTAPGGRLPPQGYRTPKPQCSRVV